MNEIVGDLEEPMRIASLAEELRVVMLAQSLTLPAILHPQGPLLEWTLHSVMGVKDADDFPMTITGREEGQTQSYSAREVLEAVRQIENADLHRDMMSTSMIMGALRIGKAIMNGGYCTESSPLMQFARHFRNACAHGDRWNFEGKEPRHEASVRSLTLTKELHGKAATWTVVDPYTYFQFLEDVRVYFTTLALRSAADAAIEHAKVSQKEPYLWSAVSEEFVKRKIPSSHAGEVIFISRAVARGDQYYPTVLPKY